MATCGACNGRGGCTAVNNKTGESRWIECPLCDGTGER